MLFINELYFDGTGDYMDAVAVHPYTFPHPLADAPAGGSATVKEIHRGNG